jgi:hypothetical protein
MKEVDGTPIAEGSLLYIGDTVGTVAYSPAAVDNCGNMIVPGTLIVNDGVVLHGVCPSVSSASSMSLQPTGGNVGIGLCNPQSTLDVCGTVHATGTVKVDSVSNLNGGISVRNNLTVDTGGNLTITNGNLTVNGDGNNTGSVQGAYVTFPDLNINGLESYLWNQSNTLYWQDNMGKIQPISGWWPILNPAGTTLTLLDPNSATTFQIATTLNALMTRISTQGAFFVTNPPVSPSITFRTSLSMKFGYSSSATVPFTVSTTATVAAGATTLLLLKNYVNGIITVGGSPLSIVSLSNNTVIFQCLPGYYYKFIDVNFPGEASLFMNHFNIQIPLNYIGTSYTAKNLPGGAIIDPSFGYAPIPAVCSGLVASGVTTSSFDVSWNTSANAVYYAVSNVTGGTIVVRTIVVATTYTFSNLMQSVPYTITVVPLGQFDAGAPAVIMKTITPRIIAVETLGPTYWSTTPATAGPYITSFPVVSSVSPAVWLGAFNVLKNTKQVNSIVLKYYADIGNNGFTDAICYTTTQYSYTGTFFYAGTNKIQPVTPGSQYAIGSPWYGGYTPPSPIPSYGPTPPITDINIINSIFNGDSTTGNITPGTINFSWYCGGRSGFTLNNMKVEQFQVSFVYLV